MYDRRYRPEVLDVDLPWFRQRLGQARFSVFRTNVEAALREVQLNPHGVGSPCKYELAGLYGEPPRVGYLRIEREV